MRRAFGRSVRRLAAMTILRGSSVTCECCARSFRRFIDFRGRERVRCAWCGSLERHRVMQQIVTGLPPVRRVLHVAPDAVLYRRGGGQVYVTLDLYGEASVRGDLTSLPFSDDSFDLVVCSHVLEHVSDDARALREMARALAPAGTLLLLVPVDPDRGITYENSAITAESDRLEHFGQEDHVRIYGRDVLDRVQAVGWEVEEVHTTV
jgi:SAM-dependent methyltransferase